MIVLIQILAAIGISGLFIWNRRRRSLKALRGGSDLPTAKALMSIALPPSTPPLQPLLPDPTPQDPARQRAAASIRAYCDQVKRRACCRHARTFINFPLAVQLRDLGLTPAQVGLTEDDVAECRHGEREMARDWIREYCQRTIEHGLPGGLDQDGFYSYYSLAERLEDAGLAASDIPLTPDQVQACRRSEIASEAKAHIDRIQYSRKGGDGQGWHFDRLRTLIEKHGLAAQDLRISDIELCWIFNGYL